MRKPVVSSTKEEIKQKLCSLYSDSLDSNRNILDFDRKYDFFPNDESLLLQFSSNWFRPEKYNSDLFPSSQVDRQIRNVCQEGGSYRSWTQLKQESLLEIEKSMTSNNLTGDLEVLGRTPYQIGVDGEKFRVVAATLQKCNSPFVRRTFHFTSNGIVEAVEKKEDTDNVLSSKQIKAILPQQKFVRIRRFRVIKKDNMPLENYILPQKIRITNGQKTRFLTVRIRSKNAEVKTKVEMPETITQAKSIGVVPATTATTETTAVATGAVQTEVEENTSGNVSEPETSSASLTDEETDLMKRQDEVEETGNTFKCNSCGKHFPTYLSCLTHVRSHQRQPCQFCPKRFLTVKMLRDHVRMQHHHPVRKPGTSEDRITTATSKFGRTRQVLNVAGLRSKYKML